MQDVNRPGEERTLGLVVRVAHTKDQIFKALVRNHIKLPCMQARTDVCRPWANALHRGSVFK